MPEQGEDILGDVDGDGKLSIFDATAIQKYLVRIINDGSDLGDGKIFNSSVADFNKDGIITINDATQLQIALTKM